MDSNVHDIGSTKPYMIRALYEWCTDNGLTPYLAVRVDAGVRVPMEFVKNGEIVLNIGFDATSGLNIDNEAIRFKARFGGVARDILVPITHVTAIYARENGQGMAFPVDAQEFAEATAEDAPAAGEDSSDEPPSPPAAAPHLRPVQSGPALEGASASASSEPDPSPPGPKPGGARLTRVK